MGFIILLTLFLGNVTLTGKLSFSSQKKKSTNAAPQRFEVTLSHGETHEDR